MGKHRIYEHRLDLFGTHLWLARTPKAWEKLRTEHLSYIANLDGNAGMVHSGVWKPNDDDEFEEHHVAVFIDMTFGPHRTRQKPAYLLQTISHEATHAALRIFEQAGEDVRPDSEVFCYVVGWISKWAYDWCRPLTE